jgi:hypothetical protein
MKKEKQMLITFIKVNKEKILYYSYRDPLSKSQRAKKTI